MPKHRLRNFSGGKQVPEVSNIHAARIAEPSVNTQRRITVCDAEINLWEFASEHRLWAAVLIKYVDEYTMHLRIAATARDEARPVSSYHWEELQSLRRELNNRWFKEICSFINLDRDQIEKRLNYLDKLYGLSECKFSADVRPEKLKRESGKPTTSHRTSRRKVSEANLYISR